jgi:hypothetical protein
MIFENIDKRTIILIDDKFADKGAVAAFITVFRVMGKRYYGCGVILF